ncbi:MAG: hypothetical protein ABIG89_02770 [Candidatus Woesearchaeota archaeon]
MLRIRKTEDKKDCSKSSIWGKIGLVLLGAAAGAATYHVMSDDGATEAKEKIAAVDTESPEGVFDVFKSGADTDSEGLANVMSGKYQEDRDAMKNVVGVCNGVVKMEKDYVRGLFAKMPVLPGSADPNEISLDMKIYDGQRAATINYSATGAEYIVTENKLLGTKSLGLYVIPAVASAEKTKENSGNGNASTNPGYNEKQEEEKANPGYNGSGSAGAGKTGTGSTAGMEDTEVKPREAKPNGDYNGLENSVKEQGTEGTQGIKTEGEKAGGLDKSVQDALEGKTKPGYKGNGNGTEKKEPEKNYTPGNSVDKSTGQSQYSDSFDNLVTDIVDMVFDTMYKS